MGLKDKLKSFVTGETPEEKEEQVKEEKLISNAKYPDKECALCGKLGAEKKWAGQYWHKSCMRKMRGKAKGMI